MFVLKEWIHNYNHDMCGMMSYTISDKKFVTDNIRVRLVPYSTHTYPYLYPRTSVFVFVSEGIRIRIRIWIKIWKQIWFLWYPSVFDPITPLVNHSKYPSFNITNISLYHFHVGTWGYLLIKCLLVLVNHSQKMFGLKEC